MCEIYLFLTVFKHIVIVSTRSGICPCLCVMLRLDKLGRVATLKLAEAVIYTARESIHKPDNSADTDPLTATKFRRDRHRTTSTYTAPAIKQFTCGYGGSSGALLGSFEHFSDGELNNKLLRCSRLIVNNHGCLRSW